MSAVIQTKNLTKLYGKHRGVLELNLEVEQGEVFGSRAEQLGIDAVVDELNVVGGDAPCCDVIVEGSGVATSAVGPGNNSG